MKYGKLETALATATALGMLTGIAAAGNESFILQAGNFNAATVTQTGENNKAGSADRVMTQERNNLYVFPNKHNQLTVVQSGSGNSVGTGVNNNLFKKADGIYQHEDYADNASSWGTQRNVIDILQSSNGNTIGAISQYTKTHDKDNSVWIRQSAGEGNTIGSISQQRTQATANIVKVEQTGWYNTVAKIMQYVKNIGNTNLIEVDVKGDHNGNASWLTGAAGMSGATSSTLIQGDSNAHAVINSTIKLTITGHNNEFGVTQYGSGASHSNQLNALLISGNYNEVGIYQEGNENIVSLAEVGGLHNNIGIRQVGLTNTARVAAIGDENTVNARQYNNNNKLEVDILGDNNGNAGFANSGAFLTALSKGLSSGDIVQHGGAELKATITGNDNQFAFLQMGGNLNKLTATINGSDNQAVGIQDGSSNQATLTQGGDANVSVFSQLGSSNTVNVTQ